MAGTTFPHASLVTRRTSSSTASSEHDAGGITRQAVAGLRARPEDLRRHGRRDGPDTRRRRRLHRCRPGPVHCPSLYAAASLLGWLASYLPNNVVVSTIADLRSDVEAKIHRLPLRYYDEAQRGDLLSRVTNDLDNLSADRAADHHAAPQLGADGDRHPRDDAVDLPLLSIIALLTIPAGRDRDGDDRRSAPSCTFAAVEVDGHLERADRGGVHRARASDRLHRQRQVMDAFDDRNEKLYNASWRAQFISGIVMPTIMFLGNVNYVAVAVVGGLRVASGSLSRAKCKRSSSTRANSPSR